MAPEVPGEIVRDSERLTILLKRHAEKKTFTAEGDLEEAIRMARYDSFLFGREMAAGKRVTKLRAKKRAADNGGPPLTRAEEVTLRFLGLLYPPPRRSIDESILAEHPFWETAIGERLARSLAALINVLDPDVIVLGGGISNIETLYIGLPDLIGRYAFSDGIRTRVVRAAHGDSSGVRGAAWLWPIRKT
jgi:hypothetical protein